MKRITALVLSTLLVFSLMGCGTSKEISTQNNEESKEVNTEEVVDKTEEVDTNDESKPVVDQEIKKLKVAFVVQDLSNESMAYSYKIMEQLSEAYGFEMTAFDESNDPQKGVDAIGTCIAQKYDAIICTPSDSSAVVASLMEAQEAGITVGMYTADLPSESQQFRDFYVGVNDTQAGEAAAKAIIEAFPDGCNVVEIGGQSGHDAQIKRSDGFAKGLEGSNINVLASQNCEAWATEDAMSIMEDFITKHGDKIDAVFCHWDNGATGVINALKNAGIDGVFVAAIDGCSAGYDQVIAGTQSVCISQPFNSMIIEAFECIEADKNNESYDAVNWVPMDIVTAENVNTMPYPEW